jgi:hypothetical protein
MSAPLKHKRSREYAMHGHYALKRALLQGGTKAINHRLSVIKELIEWCDNLVADLGGKDNVSVQQEALIEMTSRSKLMLNSLDNWLLSQPSLINRKKKSLIPIVLQRKVIADGLLRLLKELGIARVTPPPKWPWEIDDQDKQNETNNEG